MSFRWQDSRGRSLPETRDRRRRELYAAQAKHDYKAALEYVTSVYRADLTREGFKDEDVAVELEYLAKLHVATASDKPREAARLEASPPAHRARWEQIRTHRAKLAHEDWARCWNERAASAREEGARFKRLGLDARRADLRLEREHAKRLKPRRQAKKAKKSS